MEGITHVDDGWGLAAFLGYAALTLVFGGLLTRVKKSSDQQDTASAPAIEQAQKVADLSPAVHALSDEVQDLKKTLKRMAVITEQRYPMALNVIRQYRRRYPSCDILVPQQVEEDL